MDNIRITDTDHLSYSLFKIEILGGLNCAIVEFMDISANDGECGNVAVHLMSPRGAVRLDECRKIRS